MQCPNCSNQLTTAVYEGFNTHVCPSREGRLLDEKKLGEIEKLREVFIPRDQGHYDSNHYDGI